MSPQFNDIVWAYSKERFLSTEGFWKSNVTISSLDGVHKIENAFEMYDEYIVTYHENYDGPDMPDWVQLEDCNRLTIVPGSTTFPHLASSGGEVFVYNETTEAYENKTPLNRLNQTKDEFIHFVDGDGIYQNYRFTFKTFWSQDNKVYAMTGSPYTYDLWEYQNIGTASVGKHTIAASKVDNKYGSIS